MFRLITDEIAALAMSEPTQKKKKTWLTFNYRPGEACDGDDKWKYTL